MTLAEFLTEHNLTQRVFAQAAGISQTTVSEVSCGQGMLLDTAALIRHHTGGLVDYTDLVSDEVRAVIQGDQEDQEDQEDQGERDAA